MENTTSSALIIAISTLIAALLMTVFLFMYHNERKVIAVTDEKAQSVDIIVRPGDVESYVGTTIRGDKLVGLIRSMDGHAIKIYVKESVNGKKSGFVFDFTKDHFYEITHKDADGKLVIDESINDIVLHNDLKADDKQSFSDGNTDTAFIQGTENESPKRYSFSEALSVKGISVDNPYYISPFSEYTCSADVKNNVITGLTFSRTK